MVDPQRISHYVILKKLGSGGMGEVYLAEDTNLGRTVALKMLPSQVVSDQSRLHRFIQEAKAASVLKHPGVAGIYDLGEADGVPFIVMEHVEGETLDSRIKASQLATSRILDLAVQIADAMEEAHSKGVIHRDIKPANIMITQKGQVKILDFGLAKITLASNTQSDVSKLGTQTGTEPGLVLGTVHYMSPEQALGKPVDHRSDLFSFGVVLYQMVTQRLPFNGESQTDTINKIVNRVPDGVARYNYNCPPELEHIIRKSLEKDPENRYQSAHDLLIDLKNLKRDTESGITQARVTPASSSPSWMRIAVLAGIFLTAVVTILFVMKSKSLKPAANQDLSPKRKMIAVLPFQNLGASNDQYFAEGMTDEITSRLASVADLGVISRGSAMQYQKRDKNTKQIGQELGVDYLLDGTIRWDRSTGTNRVRVTPKLIRVTDDTQVWSDIYDHVIDDVFQVQSEIAQNVITQLGVTLGESQQKNLHSIPTASIPAYEAYLRGNEYYNRPTYDQTTIGKAIENYQRAVELDPQFALAYAGLAKANLNLFHEGFDISAERLNMAKAAVDQGLKLKPDLPAVHVALGFYHYHGLGEYEKALADFNAALKATPNDSDTLAAIGYVERRQGKFEDSVRHLVDAWKLNPRVADLPIEIGVVLSRMRRYAEADSYYVRSLQLVPDQTYGYGERAANMFSWKKDLKLSREILQKMPQSEPEFFHLTWAQQEILERNYQAALDRLGQIDVELFQDESEYNPKVMIQAMVFHFANQKEKALEYFEKSKVFLESKAKERVTTSPFHRALGLTYAGLGRKEDAIREAKLAMQMLPVSKDSLNGPWNVQGLVDVYILVGENEKAMDQIEYLLSIPSFFSSADLEFSPRFDPLRKLPRFQKLIAKYKNS